LLDAWGHGSSEKPHEPAAYEPPLFVADMLAVLDHLHIAKAHFCDYPRGRIGFVIAKYAPERFSSFIVGGASHPYPENRDAFALWLQELRKGAGAIAPLWEVPLSPGLQARLLTNDMDAIVAYWRQRMESPGFEEVLTDPAYAVLALCWGGGRPICQCQGSRHAHAQARRILFRSDLVRPHDMRFLATVPC
jgi:pimeloyl-ACP methyl ester carboxylesterase